MTGVTDTRIPMSEAAVVGVDALIDDWIRPEVGDLAILAFGNNCQRQAAYTAAGLRLRGVTARIALQADRNDSRFAMAIRRILSDYADARRIHVVVAELDTMSFTAPLRELAAELGDETVNVLRIIGCSNEFFELAVSTPPEMLRAVNAGLLDKLMSASRCRVLTAAGTDLDIELDAARYTWMSNHGCPEPGRFRVLPAGEVNTFPANISGRMVVDGAINVSRSVDFDARLAQNPVLLNILDGELVDFTCLEPTLARFLDRVMSFPYARRVGELGIGTNLSVQRFTALNSHVNERHPGVHLGFGEHGQPGRVAYRADIHIDFIVADARIILADGMIDTSRLAPSHRSHPSALRSEDIGGEG